MQQELDALRATVAELVPVEGRPVGPEDTVVVDLVSPQGETRRDYVVELGRGAVVEEIEQSLVGHERRRDEGDRVRARRRLEAGRVGDGEGDQGEGAAGARRRARALGERVRHARRAARRHRGAPARADRRGGRGAVPRPTSPTRSSPRRRSTRPGRSSRRARASCCAGSRGRSRRAASRSTRIWR